jgi:hypothetical protein
MHERRAAGTLCRELPSRLGSLLQFASVYRILYAFSVPGIFVSERYAGTDNQAEAWPNRVPRVLRRPSPRSH